MSFILAGGDAGTVVIPVQFASQVRNQLWETHIKLIMEESYDEKMEQKMDRHAGYRAKLFAAD